VISLDVKPLWAALFAGSAFRDVIRNEGRPLLLLLQSRTSLDKLASGQHSTLEA
jgi:hypothetical protein